MITRQEIKARGKLAFKANYWKCVLVSLIIIICIGSGAAAGSSHYHDHYADPEVHVVRESVVVEDGVVYSVRETSNVTDYFRTAVLVAASVLLASVALLHTFLLNPLSMGCRNFYVKNSDAPAGLGELKRGFKPNYWKTVGTLILRNIFLILWSLLFIIPGIIKSFSYSMVPYILAENPEMGCMEAIKRSNEMMKGHKMDLFVFELSFILWHLFSLVTCGIAGIFYVNPYVDSSTAQFYIALRDGQQMA
ncbi:MAG: DUF975 family protein [Sphaerochaetaceae bacterium]|nr:DUF975 family protein [Sphaerochaetaceae bacterium]